MQPLKLYLLCISSTIISSKNIEIPNKTAEDALPSSNYCNLCIYENRDVGSPNLTMTISEKIGGTCGSIQRAANNGEFSEQSCSRIQQFAEYCNCLNFNTSNIEEAENLDPPAQSEEESSKSDLLASLIASSFLFFLVFGLSATVPVKQLKQQLTNKWALATGAGMQFLVMPLMGFLSVIFFKNVTDEFTKAMGLTLMVVTASPGGSYSNWWCSLFNADLALSMAMTAVSTILSLAMLPLNLIAYSHLAYGMHDDNADNIVGALDFKTLFISLGVVMTALLSGLYSSYKLDSKNFKIWANRGASISGIGLIVASVFLSSKTETNFWNMDWKFYVGVAFPCLTGLVLANVFSFTCARLKKPECVAIAVECCYQNTGIAMSVAVTMFKDYDQQAQALAVPIFYGFVQTVVVASYCFLSWKLGWTKAPANKRLCVVLSKPYEIVEPDRNSDVKNSKEDDELERGNCGNIKQISAPDVVKKPCISKKP